MMFSSDKPSEPSLVGFKTSSQLAKQIFAADLPEQFIRTIPTQSLYCIIQNLGLESSGDLIEITTTEQLRLILDFDLWEADNIDEGKFWSWLALTDSVADLKILQKIFQSVDLKIIAFFISKYITSVVFEDPTDAPPDINYFTPDKGSTWIKVDTGDEENNFLLNRLIALIFETSADLFYQLLAIPMVSTQSQLEEESYNDREKRLTTEGIPDKELAAEVHAPFYLKNAQEKLAKLGDREQRGRDILPITPLIYNSDMASPLKRLFLSIKNLEECESELTFILNAAIVRWNIDFHDSDSMNFLLEQVKGSIAVGIELMEGSNNSDLAEIYEVLGLQSLYRLGFTRLMQLHKEALQFSKDHLRVIYDTNKDDFTLIAHIQEPFPSLPCYEKHSQHSKQAIASLKEVNDISAKLKTLL